VLELISSTYGAPEEVAAAYRDTEAKVKAALQTPAPAASAETSGLRRFFGVFMDARAYTSLIYMLLTLATGIAYFTVVVTGLSLSVGFAILIIGIPFFLAFIGITRVIALGEGRLLEAVTGERMPRRPLHPGPRAGWLTRIGDMLKDARTWTTLLYMLMMLPLGIVYFTVAVTMLSVGLAFTAMPFVAIAQRIGLAANLTLFSDDARIGAFALAEHSLLASLLLGIVGVVLLTLLMHLGRGLARAHARLAKTLLVEPGAA
jgi:hypothetical protein